ncbi:MAG: FKBP-type peptidyl-prolyl cis-trans isomerase [Bacteroidales bacterium]|jgi:FKBP-type peptidyl-prolyl cis-trans isomerase|nr:FKBP-type peptidyl-prolyl cis-trans isomerase [Bacteroidales bacterium]
MKRLIVYILLVSAFVSCGKGYNESETDNIKPKQDNSKSKKEKNDKALLNINKVLAEKEATQIKGYIERRKWKMKVVEGVFIEKTRQGEGRAITDSSIVKLEYTLDLITGEKLYSSSKDGVKTIRFGVSGTEPVGLLHILCTMKMGDEANLIIPSYLGYGLYGDGKKVPAHATLVYSIKIVDVK